MDSEYEISFEEMDAAAAEGYAYQAHQMDSKQQKRLEIYFDNWEFAVANSGA